ncbi:hypothetical protein VNI00_014522 [Paramarasmius palmivorus]|uniref:Uncharacterized protein n=1 Tax=Paramarasmius palmivorus TaxID=297713 RepID=A0AAW0BSQ1_9AGAR
MDGLAPGTQQATMDIDPGGSSIEQSPDIHDSFNIMDSDGSESPATQPNTLREEQPQGAMARKRKDGELDETEMGPGEPSGKTRFAPMKYRKVADPKTVLELEETKRKLEEARNTITSMESSYNDKLEHFKKQYREEYANKIEEQARNLAMRELMDQKDVNSSLLATQTELQSRVRELEQAQGVYDRVLELVETFVNSLQDEDAKSEVRDDDTRSPPMDVPALGRKITEGSKRWEKEKDRLNKEAIEQKENLRREEGITKRLTKETLDLKDQVQALLNTNNLLNTRISELEGLLDKEPEVTHVVKDSIQGKPSSVAPDAEVRQSNSNMSVLKERLEASMSERARLEEENKQALQEAEERQKLIDDAMQRVRTLETEISQADLTIQQLSAAQARVSALEIEKKEWINEKADLERKNGSLEAQKIASMIEKYTLEDLHKKLSAAQGRVSTLEREKKKLEDKNGDSENEKGTLENENAALKKGLEAEQKKAQGSISVLEREKQELERKNGDLENEKTTLENEKATLEDQKVMLEDQKATLEDQKATLEDQKATLEDQKATLEDQKATLEDQKATLEDQKATLEDQKATLEDQKAMLEDQKATLENEKTALKKGLEAEQKKAQERVSVLEREKQELAQKNRDLEADTASLENERKSLEESKKALEKDKQRLETDQHKLSAAQKRVSVLEREKTELMAQRKILENEKAALTKEKEEDQQELLNAQTRVDDLERQINGMTQDKANLERELSSSSIDLQNKLSIEREKAKGLQDQVDDLNAELNSQRADQDKSSEDMIRKHKARETSYMKRIEELQSQADRVEEAECALQVSQSELDTCEQHLNDARLNVTQLNDEISDLKTKIALAEAGIPQDIDRLNSKVKKYQEQLIEEQKKHGEAKRALGQKDHQIATLQSEKNAVDALNEALKARIAQSSASSSKSPAVEEELRSKTRELDELKRQLDEERKKNVRLGKEKERAPTFDVAAYYSRARFPRTLSSTDVINELRNADTRRSYGLGAAIPSPPTPSKSSHPWNNSKGSRYQTKPTAQAGSPPEEPNDTNYEDDAESDRSKTLERYLKLGARSGEPVDPRTARLAINVRPTFIQRKSAELNMHQKLGREILHEALSKKYSIELWLRPAVPSERLRQFCDNEDTHPPKIHATWLDKEGLTTQQLRTSKWNSALKHRLSLLAADIVERCPDKNMFGEGNIDWHDLFGTRLSEVYVDIINGRPRGEEEEAMPELAMARVAQEQADKNRRSNHVSIRVAKYLSRLAVAGKMVRDKLADEEDEAVALWRYVIQTTEKLGHNGMSDEESAEEEVTFGSGLQHKIPVKLVLELSWRHPSLCTLYSHVDKAPGLEKQIFAQTGRTTKLKRVRVKQKSTRAPPKGLHRCLLDPGFLEQLTEVQAHDLKFKEDEFALRGFRFDEFSYDRDVDE